MADYTTQPTDPRDIREATSFDKAVHIFGYHAGTDATVPVHEAARDEFIDMMRMLDRWMDDIAAHPRDRALVWTKMQEASMAFHAAVAFVAPIQHSKEGGH